ncbi:unnamed protein product, partial [Ascophyllum nodosum]
GPSRCVDAFSIALNQADSSGWYSSTLELQLASLQFCVVCRNVSTLHLIVKNGMETLLLDDAPTSDVKVKTPCRTRVPTLRPLILTWKLPIQAIDGVVWPASLQRLTFGEYFNQAIDGVVWPASLQRLTFGEYFNQAIDGVVWPASLQQLTFGDGFNQAIDGVVWPASLQQLTFGYNFDHAMDGVS